MDARLRIFKVETKMLRQRLNRRLTRVISRIARRIRDPLLAARNHNRTGCCVLPLFLESRNKRVKPVYHAVEIRIEYLNT